MNWFQEWRASRARYKATNLRIKAFRLRQRAERHFKARSVSVQMDGHQLIQDAEYLEIEAAEILDKFPAAPKPCPLHHYHCGCPLDRG
jgi:hypothetical protein